MTEPGPGDAGTAHFSKRFKNKVAVVTGAASGIGRATALAFAREGASVVLADVNQAGGASAVAEIEQSGGRGLFCATDVSEQASVSELVGKTVSAFGAIDILCNNAAYLFGNFPLLETSEEVWDRTLDVNLKGIYWCCRMVLPQMLEKKAGSIVNVASVLGVVAVPAYAPYITSKGGIVSLTRSLAIDYGPHGVRVNAVCPGSIETPPVERAISEDPQLKAEIAAKVALGRLGTPTEVASAVLFLSSEEAAYITGSLLFVDGGWTAV